MSHFLKKFRHIENSSFYCELPWWGKVSSCYIRGDMIVLIPFLFLILLIGLLSIKWMLIVLGIYITVRNLGELIYWLLQQFADRKYRPYDYGFKNLDNNAIYILYQTMSIGWITIGVCLVLFVILRV